MDVLPDGSVAVDLTVVFPTGKNDPETGVVVNVAEQLSDAVTEKLTIIPQVPAALRLALASASKSAGVREPSGLTDAYDHPTKGIYR